MVANPVTTAFLATIKACTWASPDHVALIVGPPLWIKLGDGSGVWSFGVNDTGAVAITRDVFDVLATSTDNFDGTFTEADGVTRKQLVPANGQVRIDEPPESPPPPPPPPR